MSVLIHGFFLGMIGYGMAKAAVHQLTKSLATDGSGLPSGSLVASILPVTLDTPMNRKWMPKADTTTWTPLEFIAKLVIFIFNYLNISYYIFTIFICKFIYHIHKENINRESKLNNKFNLIYTQRNN